MSTDIKTLADELKSAFEQFKAEHTKEVSDIRKDIVQTEKVDRINASITELQARFETLKAEKDALELSVNRKEFSASGEKTRDFVKESQTFFAALPQSANRQDVADKVEAYKTYANAFANVLRFNDDALPSDVKAAMRVASNPDGGYFVPTEFSNRIITKLFETSPMRQIATVQSITGDSIKMLNDTNDATSGAWVGEETTRADTATPQVGETTLYVHEQYAQPKVTQRLLDMANVDVEAWLVNKVTDKMIRTENTAFVTGNGIGKPRGFTSYSATAVTTADASRDWGKLQYVATGATYSAAAPFGTDSLGSKAGDALIDLIGALKPDYRSNAVFTMNRLTQAALRKQRNAEGNYIIDFNAIGNARYPFTVMGYGLVTMEDMADVGTDSFSIAFGDFGAGYMIVDNLGMTMLRDPFTNKPYVKFYMTKRTGGDVVNFDAIKLLKFAAS